MSKIKILHTSDIHIREYNDDRWQTLESLLKIAKSESIDLFIICGDLFNGDINAEYLRHNLRELFSNNGFKIVIIPGNHDANSYGTKESGLYFGSDVSIIYNLNEPIEYEKVRIWGYPFEAIGEKTFLGRIDSIKEKLTPDKCNILLYHGELLDAFFSRNEFGEEGDERYMPCKLSFFKDLNFSYILAGHFHSRFEVWKPNEHSFFIYPGSPISITRREKGLRKVNILEVGSPPLEYTLDSPHFEEVIVEFDPFTEKDVLKAINEKIKELHPNARIKLTVKGYINSLGMGKTETEIVEEIEEVLKNVNIELDYQIEDIKEILEDDLFLKFLKYLDRGDHNIEQKEQMRNLVINAMRRLNS